MRHPLSVAFMACLLACTLHGEVESLFAQGSLEPDLRPHTRSGDTGPVVPSSIQETQTTNTLYAGATTFFDWHVINDGAGATSDGFYVELWVDDRRYINYPFPALDVGGILGFPDWGERIDSPGLHTVRLVVDPEDAVAESDETNNTWQGQFYWDPVNGWLGEYFKNSILSGDPWLSRDDPAIAFEWYDEAPDPSLPNDQFSVRWTRTMSFTAGVYRFQVLHDDGALLVLDGVTILDMWSCANCRQTDGVNWLLTDGDHELKLEFWENGGWSSAVLDIIPLSNVLYLPLVSKGAVAGAARAPSSSARSTPTPVPGSKPRLTAPVVRTPSAGPTPTPTLRPAC